MIRGHLAILRYALMTADALSADLAVHRSLSSSGSRSWTRWRSGISSSPPARPRWCTGSGGLHVFGFWDLYRLRTHVSFRSEAAGIVRAAAVWALAVLSFLFLLRFADVSRVFLVLLLISSAIAHDRISLRPATAPARYAPAWSAGAPDADRGRRVGSGGIRRRGRSAARPGTLGRRSPAQPARRRRRLRRPMLGSIDDIEKVLHGRVVDEVAICLSPQDWEYVEPVTRFARKEGKLVRVSNSRSGRVAERWPLRRVGQHARSVTFLYGPGLRHSSRRCKGSGRRSRMPARQGI